MRFPIKLFSVFLFLFVPFCWSQQPSPELKARTLFYHENPDNDQLPPASAVKPPKATKGAASKRPPVVNGATTDGSGVTESFQSGNAEPKQQVTGVPEGEGSGQSRIPTVQNLGLRYNVLLVDRSNNAVIEAANPARNFHEGDCIALEFAPNRSGYLYVLEQGSSGAWKPLFPSPKLPNESNIVKALTPVRVPESTCFGIHPPQGEERVFVILTRNPANVYELQESIRQENGEPKSSLLAQNINRLSKDMEKRLASRDLEIDTVAQPQSAGERPYSVYIANASNVAIDELSVEILIKHN